MKKYSISYFGFDRIYDDKTCLRFQTSTEVLLYLHETKAIVTPPIPEDLISHRLTYLIPTFKHGLDERYDAFNKRFQVGSTADFIERKMGFFEQISLMSSKDNDWAANFILNKNTACEDFFMKFRDEMSSIFPSAEKNRFLLDSKMFPSIKWPKLSNFSKLKLSRREKECFDKIVLGLTVREIALRLNLSIRTVEHYIESLRSKLGCSKKTEIIERGIELKLIDPSYYTKS
jgi:DNA-binding CsgD family transcriptional regulator